MIYELSIAALVFVAVLAFGAAWVTAKSVHRRRIQQRLLEGDDLDDQDAYQAAGASPWVQAVRQVGHRVSRGGPSRTLREQLARAGYQGEAAATVYLGAKILLFIFGAVGAGLAVLPTAFSSSAKALIAFTAGACLFFIPNMIVSLKRRQRKQQVQWHLPDAVDLLEVCVSSGMSMDMAWNMVADEIRKVSTVLADEMALTNLEIHLGAKRVRAMRHLAERTGVEDIGSLVAVLVQSDRFGTSVSDALRSFSSSMREGRSTQAEEAAERMSVRLLFPMVLFIFPAVLIVLVGPAGMKLAELLGT